MAAINSIEAEVEGRRKKRVSFCARDDIMLMKEVLAHNSYAIGDANEFADTWQAIAENTTFVVDRESFAIDVRRAQERITLLLEHFRKQDLATLRRSGTEEECSEKDQLLQELADMVHSRVPLKRKATNGSGNDKRVALLLRESAMNKAKAKPSMPARASCSQATDACDLPVTPDLNAGTGSTITGVSNVEAATDVTPSKKKVLKAAKPADALLVYPGEKSKEYADYKNKELELQRQRLEVEQRKFALEEQERRQRMDIERRQADVMMQFLQKKM